MMVLYMTFDIFTEYNFAKMTLRLSNSSHQTGLLVGISIKDVVTVVFSLYNLQIDNLNIEQECQYACRHYSSKIFIIMYMYVFSKICKSPTS